MVKLLKKKLDLSAFPFFWQTLQVKPCLSAPCFSLSYTLYKSGQLEQATSDIQEIACRMTSYSR